MTQAPERIWRDKPQTKRGYVDGMPSWPTQSESHEGTEYIRADLVPQWQPIETAPKDGTWVLVSGGDAYDEFNLFKGELDCSVSPHVVNYPNDVSVAMNRPVVAFWNDDQKQWAFAHWDSAWRAEYYSPTHWMPLPAPPSP
jgi:hypothetical protein